MVSPWPSPDSNQANLPPPPLAHSDASLRPPRRRRWLLVIGGLGIVVAAMVVSAGITYRVMARQNTSPAESQPSPSRAAPTYSDADRAAAKQQVCDVFDASARDHKGRGAAVVNGELNVPMVLRKLGSVVAVENALTPATPPEVAVAAHKYVDTALDAITAAMEGVSMEELTQLTEVGNDAVYAFVDVCGLRN